MLIRLIRNWLNPTWDSREDLNKSLVVDLDEYRFCGIGMDERIENLSFLGLAKVVDYEYFFWRNKGIDAVATDGCMHELSFYFGHPNEPRSGDYTGSFQYQGQSIRLSKQKSEHDVISLFGQPDSREQDDDEILLVYHSNDRYIAMEFALDSSLSCLMIGSQTADVEV